MGSSAPIPPALPWTTRLAISPISNANLTGDKIHLPQSALEQLLSAAAQVPRRDIEPEDPWARPYPTKSEEVALPHPLIVKLTNPRTRTSAYAVPREFSADEGTVAVSRFIGKTLGLDIAAAPTTDDDGSSSTGAQIQDVEISAASLPKGEKVRLRPLEAGYDDEDWKAILERYLREGFATVSEGTVLEVPRGHGRRGTWRFLVDEAKPGGSICVVDTDLEVDIEPLDEEQARETLKRRIQKKDTGGKIGVEQIMEGEVEPGEEHFYELGEWDHAAPLEIELEIVGEDVVEGEDVDVFVVTDRQHHKPRIDEHLWGDMGIETPKRIRLEPGNIELVDAKTLIIGVRGWEDPEAGEAAATDTTSRRYTLRITQSDFSSSSTTGAAASDTTTPPSPDHTRCPNCTQWIPSRTFTLHSTFCARNNLVCPTCHRLFHRTSPHYKSHWHCSLCPTSGLTPSSQHKHHLTTHTPQQCTNCPYISTSLHDLATHRTSVCPGKLHLCRFCHLLVPQEGQGDGTTPDPECILTGLSRHELTCGGRTTECDRCGRRTKLRDLEIHMKNHEMQRLTNPPPKRCANANCTRGPSASSSSASSGNGNSLGLCDVCFGPLYAPGHDPEGKALKRRLHGRIARQLLKGCGKSWCRNMACKTGRTNLHAVDPTIPLISGDAFAMAADAGVDLCVDEITQKRRVLAEELEIESVLWGSDGDGGGGNGRGGYGREWCRKAVEEGKGDRDAARRWLEREAVREGER